MNEQGSFLNERFQGRGGAVDLIDDNEEDHAQSIAHAGNNRQLNLIEHQTGEQSQENGHDDLRGSDRRISNSVSQRSLRNIEELIQPRALHSFVRRRTALVTDDSRLARRTVALRIRFGQNRRARRGTLDQNVQDEVSGIVVIFAPKAKGSEVRNDPVRRTEINRVTRREKKNRIEQLEDRIPRLMNGEDDRT